MNNKYPQLTFVFDRRNKASLTTKAAVELRIYYNYRQKYISTGIMLYANQWKNNKIINCPDSFHISSTLNELLTNVRQILLEMMEEGDIDIFSIQDKLEEQKIKNINFIEYCKERFEIRKHGKAERSIDRYNLFIKVFETWGNIQSFKDVNEANIINFDKFLASRNLTEYTKWHNYHRHLNSIMLDAIKDGYLTKNPYNNICIDKGREVDSINKCLTPEEFKKLKDTTMPTKSLEKVKDLFMFQTYTCLRYSDLAAFNVSNIIEVKGAKVYKLLQKKTKKPAIIPLLSPALSILEKYKGTLPIISNVNYNIYLKAVAQVCGIDKSISSHWARHTGATLLLNEGIPLQIVSKICGHSSSKITEQIYAKLLDETIVKAVLNVDI